MSSSQRKKVLQSWKQTGREADTREPSLVCGAGISALYCPVQSAHAVLHVLPAKTANLEGLWRKQM